MLDLSALDFDKGQGLVTVVAQDARTGAVLMVAHADREALELTLATGEMHYRSRTRGLWRKGATSGNVQRVVSLAADCDGDAVLARVVPAGPACHTGATSCFGSDATAADAVAELAATIERRAASNAAARRGSPPDIYVAPEAPRRHHQSRAADITRARSELRGEGLPASPPVASRPGQDDARAPSPAGPADAPPGGDAGPSYTQRLLADRNLRLKKLGEEAAELVTACADGDGHRAAEEAADLLYHALVAARAVGVSLDDVRRVLAERAERAERRGRAGDAR
jgi:phosphoribosyl-ATP pyrophosphohydrolase/phosphoribosyl-AMP cyclohydrolase